MFFLKELPRNWLVEVPPGSVIRASKGGEGEWASECEKVRRFRYSDGRVFIGLEYASKICRNSSLNLQQQSVTIDWLGLTLADCDRYAVPPEALLECTAADVAKVRELLAHPGISRGRPQWLKHIRAFIERGAKAEIQALHVHGTAFLTERFLPEKLAPADVLKSQSSPS
ncbi:Meiotic recombination protein SPO11-1 [Diplonema papillatum]|nr:Meiotic recombination protein SPO11-1 [Diplonema papillatum]